MPSGTTTTTRVGNKVKCKYIKGSILVTANQENVIDDQGGEEVIDGLATGKLYRDWETDRKSTRLNSSHITRSRMPSSA